MREIKFRAWDEEFKVMEYFGPKFYVDDEYWELNFVPTEEEGETPLYETNQELILMQYTGLKDKNGKEIYEGDIVKVFTVTGGKFQEDKGLQEIHWWNSGFCRGIKDVQGLPLWWLDKDTQKFEVIGNIYENPGLLKEKSGGTI